MKNSLLLIGLLAMTISSCGLKGSGETVAGPQLLTVEFTGAMDSTIQNNKGKAKLLAVPADVADVEATVIDEVEFETNEIPFSVEFKIPVDHVSKIKPEIVEGAPVKYYISMDWDSNADGVQDSTDVMIDFDKQFPHVDITQLHQQVFVK